jgi:anti-sigma-K factor RskA
MNDELDIEAAEYALGTLPPDERARLAARLESDAALREAVRFWQARLAPLDESAAAEMPRADVWRRIEQAMAAGAAGTLAAAPASNVVELRRRLALWRGAALVGGALAAGLAAIVVLDRVAFPPAADGRRYMAVVDAEGHEPALLAEVDTRTGVIRVLSLAAETPAGSSLELWHVPEGAAPRSLGVLTAGEEAQTLRATRETGPLGGIIAVSVEPEGGSPSGAPTGPVIYSGRLIPIE